MRGRGGLAALRTLPRPALRPPAPAGGCRRLAGQGQEGTRGGRRAGRGAGRCAGVAAGRARGYRRQTAERGEGTGAAKERAAVQAGVPRGPLLPCPPRVFLTFPGRLLTLAWGVGGGGSPLPRWAGHRRPEQLGQGEGQSRLLGEEQRGLGPPGWKAAWQKRGRDGGEGVLVGTRLDVREGE